MELKFIGTGSGKTSLKRYHSSFLISTDGYNLLVDSGDGVSRALLHQKIPFNSIDGILFSHLHPDHYSGFPVLIVQMKMNEREAPLDVFSHESYTDFIKELLYRSYIFEEKLGFKIDYKSFKDKELVEIDAGFSFTSRQNNHLAPNKQFIKKDQLSFSSSSFLIRVKGKNIFYTGDIGTKDDIYLFRDKKIDLMISEITHISEEELLEALRNLDPPKFYITHLSDEDEKKVANLKYLLPLKERKRVIQAFDGLEVKL
jgi:ribonuclease BN (tRNA processing enzyme)